MPESKKHPVRGSERKPMAGAHEVAPVNPEEEVQVTVVLRRRVATPTVAEHPARRAYRSREEYGAIHGADPNDIAQLEAFAHEYGLTVVSTNPAARTVVLSGSADQMHKAFDVQLAHYDVPDQKLKYRGRTGPVQLPETIHPLVMAVLGFDNRPVAKPHLRTSARAVGASYTPVEVAALYRFPTDVTGAGQTIGIIELGGGYRSADLKSYFKGLKLVTPKVSAVSVGGARNKPGSDADGEVMLDIEVAGAVANGAKIAVYFAPNTDQGFHDAIAQSVHDATRKPSVVSISWGGPEDSWTAQAREAMDAALEDAAAVGVTVTVAAGDDGSSDGIKDNHPHVDFPASSPYALACGGTRLTVATGNTAQEQVWNELKQNEGATGGGVSAFFALPDYQKNAAVPPQPTTQFKGRGVPDVSGDADPTTGYQVRVDGKSQVIGGTSAVAPLWAGLIALLNQKAGHSLGFVNPLLYQLSAKDFLDVKTGNNGAFKAKAGWDACTGLGSPNGQALASAFAKAAGLPPSK